MNNLLVYNTRNFTIIFWLICLMQLSCKKFLDVSPPSDQSTSDVVFSNTISASEALTGIYASIRTSRLFGGDEGVTIGTSMLSDELQKSEISLDPYYINALTPYQDFIWTSCYRDYLFRLNSVLEGVISSKGISEAHKNILLGEAKFMRAYIYFYLVNYYGDMPLVITTELNRNLEIERASVAEVNAQILKDLLDAQALLRDDFLKPDLTSIDIERVRPNKAAATAMLARFYLFTQQWDKAEIEATKILSDSRYQLITDDINSVFLKNSTEAIWQLQPEIYSNGQGVVPDAGRFIPFSSSQVPIYVISPFLKNAFESGDIRASNWLSKNTIGSTDYIYPYKYKHGFTELGQTESIMVLRLAEQYLIRAEARAYQGKYFGVEGAEADINKIRNRAGLSNTTATTETELINAILQERRVELFTEGGHRWLDLKRTGKINDVMEVVCPAKGGVWMPYKVLFPIPANEFEFNHSLKGDQNPGYPER